jgi:hypothetical protein
MSVKRSISLAVLGAAVLLTLATVHPMLPIQLARTAAWTFWIVAIVRAEATDRYLE